MINLAISNLENTSIDRILIIPNRSESCIKNKKKKIEYFYSKFSTQNINNLSIKHANLTW